MSTVKNVQIKGSIFKERENREEDHLEKTLGPVEVWVDLTAPQHTVTGKVLHKLLYNNSDLYEMAPNPVGCPHHGGSHSMAICGNRLEVNAWLDLFAETYPTVEYMVSLLKHHIHKEFIHGEWRKYGRINLKLAKIKILETDPKQPLPVPVFWFRSKHEKLES